MPPIDDINTSTLATSASANLPEDPSGQLPKTDYFYTTNISKEARGVSRNDLVFAAYEEGIELNPGVKGMSEYPKNQVQKSESGHVWEIDDTADNQRILIRHNNGGGIELTPDGGITISSIKNKIEVVGGGQTLIVQGEAQLIYKSNLTLKVAGEFNIECLDFNVITHGNKTETVVGTENITVGRGTSKQITGTKTTYVTEAVTDTYLSGHQSNVKGNFDHNISGNMGLYSGGEVGITSPEYINIASDNVTMSANNMTVQGGTGVIGGTAVNFVGNGAIFDEGVTAPTFHGDLDGTADKAILADITNSQNYADTNPGGDVGTASGFTITNTATPSMTQPTTSLVLDYLSKAAGGIKNIVIDKGNYIKNFMDKSSAYDGISNNVMNYDKARSKLRDPANRNNSKFVGTLIQEGILCSEFNNPTPKRLGRIIKEESSPFISDKSINIYNPKLSATYVVKKSNANVTPENQYNPLKQNNLTAKTKLGPNVTVASFLGSGDPTNLSFIRNEEAKKELAKYLYMHGLILQKIQDNSASLNGVNLQVAEGIYRPGPTETITPNTINYYKLKGKAIVYKAVDSNGKSDSLKLFEIAGLLKDQIYFDKMILSYDTNQCDQYDIPIINVRLIIIMPEISDDWNGVFSRKISTEYNGTLLSQGEFVECLPETVAQIEQKVSQKSGKPPESGVVVHSNTDRNSWPKQNIIDAIAAAVIELGPEYKAQITPNGGRASRDGGTKNHPAGEAADHFLLLNGVRVNPSQNSVLYKRYVTILVANAKAKGVRPGVGGYPTFIHYDESPWRQGKAQSAGSWNNGFDVSFSKYV